MARIACKRVFGNLKCYHTRPLNSASTSVSSCNLDEKTSPTILADYSSGLNFKDGEKIFAPLSTKKIFTSLLNLHAVSVEPMVDFGMWVMRSKMMDVPGLRNVILGIIKHSFYEHFCAGEDTKEVELTLRRLNETGLKGMLVYGVEHANDNVTCDENLKEFLKTVEMFQTIPPSSVSSVIVKISAICPMNLLKRVSDLLRWEHKDSSFKLHWKLNSFPVISDSTPMYHTLQKPESLTPKEENELQVAHERLEQLCKKCLEVNVPLLVDAEDTVVQPAIDYMTYISAIKYNKENNTLVSNTVQAYLKDSKERLLIAMQAAQKMGVPLGIKLVRGAYMSSETKLASSLGYDTPIHNSIQETHACYNECASFMLEKIATNSASAVFATHNIESSKMVSRKARAMGIDRQNPNIGFGQLYGMADALSFGLSNAGFQVSKYMPYGPVEMVMPYLLRRAEENRGMLSTSKLDKELMGEELRRRIKNAILHNDDSRQEQLKA